MFGELEHGKVYRAIPTRLRVQDAREHKVLTSNNGTASDASAASAEGSNSGNKLDPRSWLVSQHADAAVQSVGAGTAAAKENISSSAAAAREHMSRSSAAARENVGKSAAAAAAAAAREWDKVARQGTTVFKRISAQIVAFLASVARFWSQLVGVLVAAVMPSAAPQVAGGTPFPDTSAADPPAPKSNGNSQASSGQAAGVVDQYTPEAYRYPTGPQQAHALPLRDRSLSAIRSPAWEGCQRRRQVRMRRPVQQAVGRAQCCGRSRRVVKLM